jgi:voltage-gated potassium channel
MRRILTIVGLLISLTAVGACGYCLLLPEASWLDGVYMAVITLTTLGSHAAGDPAVFDVDPRVQVFTIGYLLIGLGTFTYSAFQLGQWVISAQMRSVLERKRMQREKEISKLSGHSIVCGQGRMGTTICEYLSARGKPFVVIDCDEERLEEMCTERGWMFRAGDATDDELLKEAGIERAQSLASVLPTDADNVYVVLSARMLASDLQIIARASDQKAVEKLQHAGATRIVSPFSSGAVKMARFMMNPSVEDFLEIADDRGNDLELADIHISEESPYVGKALMETDLRDKGVMVIAVRRASGEHLMPPGETTVIQQGDSLLAFGSTGAVAEMIGKSDMGSQSG